MLGVFHDLAELQKNGWVQFDQKPDNLLFSDDLSSLKMCDFGESEQVN